MVRDRPHCIWMIGLSGSGKSTVAEEYAKKYDAKIISSDKIREELYGDENIQGDPNEVFRIVHERICDLLKSGFSIIYDATNLHLKYRRKFFNYCKDNNIQAIHHAIVMCTPYRLCLHRNKYRDRVVPEEVIKKQLYSFNIPFFEEGFDFITLYGWSNNFQDITLNSQKNNVLWNEKYYRETLNMMKNFDQKNHHHTLDLYSHCDTLSNLVYEITDNRVLLTAGAIHDIGKLYTQEIGEDGEAYYYGHAEVGTYNLLSNLDIFNLTESEILECLFYINYHMYLYSWDNEKTKEKYKKIFGEKKYHNLYTFHYADLHAK